MPHIMRHNTDKQILMMTKTKIIRDRSAEGAKDLVIVMTCITFRAETAGY